MDSLREASLALQKSLATYEGVSDVADSFRAGKQEVTLSRPSRSQAARHYPSRPRQGRSDRLSTGKRYSVYSAGVMT